MRQISLSKVAIAASTFTFASLLSVGWSEQRGVSLSVDSAQAARHASYGRTGSTGTATMRTTAYRGGGGRYGRGPNNLGGLVGGDDAGTPGMGFGRASYGRTGAVGAAAVGTGAAVAATSPGWGWGGGPYGTGYAAGNPGWGWGGGPYYAGAGYYGGGGPYAGTGYYAGGPYGGPTNANAFGGPVGWWGGGVNSHDHDNYMRNLRDSGYDPKNDFNSNGTLKTQ
jgi:hypothetical protein